jgi:hypothetical protein
MTAATLQMMAVPPQMTAATLQMTEATLQMTAATLQMMAVPPQMTAVPLQMMAATKLPSFSASSVVVKLRHRLVRALPISRGQAARRNKALLLALTIPKAACPGDPGALPGATDLGHPGL